MCLLILVLCLPAGFWGFGAKILFNHIKWEKKNPDVIWELLTSREKIWNLYLKLDLCSLNYSVRGRTAGGEKKKTEENKTFPIIIFPWNSAIQNQDNYRLRRNIAKRQHGRVFFLTLWTIMGDKEIDHFGRRMPSFLDVTVDYFGFRRQECPFNIWPGLYLRAALHGSGKTDNFLIPSSAGGWGSNFQTGHLLTLEKWHYYVYKFTNLRIKKPLLLLLLHRPRTTTSSKQSFTEVFLPPSKKWFLFTFSRSVSTWKSQ